MKRRVTLLSMAALLGIVYAVWQIGFHGIHPKLILWPPPVEEPPLAALDRIVSVDVQDQPLSYVVDQLANDCEVAIDISALKTNGVKGDESITFNLEGVTLQSALRLILRPYVDEDLSVEGAGGVVVLDTQSNWRGRLNNYTTKVYPLTPLFAAADQMSAQQLSVAIKKTLDSESWSPTGSGTIEAVPGALIVSQTQDIHRQIDALLAGLGQWHEGMARDELIVDPRSLENRDVICAALDQPTNLVFAGKKLSDICREISRQHAIPTMVSDDFGSRHIWADRSLSHIYNVDEQWFVSPRWSNISLRSALELMDVDRTFAIRDGSLLIGEVNEFGTSSLRVYPFGDLVSQRAFPSPDDLIESIQVCVGPDSWAEVGGTGDLDAYGMWLFVWQTARVHRKLKQFLAEQRRALSPVRSYTHRPDQTDAEQHIEGVLRNEVDLHFDKVPLIEVARHIAMEHQVHVWIDRPVMFHAAPRRKRPKAEVEIDDPFGGPGGVNPFGAAAMHNAPGRRRPKAEDEIDNPFGGSGGVNPFGAAAMHNAPGRKRTSPSVEVDNPFGGAEEEVSPFVAPDDVNPCPITFHADNAPLELALHWLLEPYEFTFVVRDESIVITTVGEAETCLEAKTYSLEPFVRADPSPETVGEFLEMIVNFIEPGTWDEVGGPGSIETHGNYLTILQGRRQHIAIQRFIDQVAEQLDHPERAEPVVVENYPGNRNARINQLLDQPCQWEFRNQPLRDLAVSLSRDFDIVATMDKIDLATGSYDLNSRITIVSDPSKTLGEAIRLALSKLSLVCVAHGGRLQILPKSLEADFPQAWIHGVMDIVDQTAHQDEFDLASFVKTWLDVTQIYDQGLYRQPYLVHPFPSMLVVIQPRPQQRACAKLLAGVRSLFEDTSQTLSFQVDIVDQDQTDAADNVRMYHVGDLNQHDHPPEDPLVTQLLGSSLPGGYDTYPKLFETRQGNSTMERIMLRCRGKWVAPSRPKGGRGSIDFAMIGDVLMVMADPVDFSDVEWIIDRLRNNLAKITQSKYSHPAEPHVLESFFKNAKEAELVLQVYDVRPLVKKYPKSKASNFVEMIETVVAPASWQRPQTMLQSPWSSSGGFGGGFGGGFFNVRSTFGDTFGSSSRDHLSENPLGGIAELKDQLVVCNTRQIQGQIENLLTFVDNESGDWPRPFEFEGDDCARAIDRVLTVLPTIGDPVQRRYAVWLLSLASQPTREMAEQFVDMYDNTHLNRDPDLAWSLLHAIGRCGPAAEAAVPILAADIELDHIESHRQLYLKTLAQLGRPGIERICDLLAVANREDETEICTILVGLGPAANSAIEPILRLHCRKDIRWIRHLVAALDPNQTTSKSIMKRWKSSGDQALIEDASTVEWTLAYPSYPSRSRRHTFSYTRMPGCLP